MAYLLHCKQEAIEVFDPTSGRHIRYETFDPNRPAPYSKAACEKLETSWISKADREEIAESPVDHGSVAQHAQDTDSDGEWVDTVEYRSSGIADIIVTGEVSVTIPGSTLLNTCCYPFFCDRSLIIRFYVDNRATQGSVGPLYLPRPSEAMGRTDCPAAHARSTYLDDVFINITRKLTFPIPTPLQLLSLSPLTPHLPYHCFLH
jgi:hypothetical protein